MFCVSMLISSYVLRRLTYFLIFDAKIGMSANLSVSQILEGGQLPNAGHALPVRPPPSRPAPPRAHTHSR